MNKATAQEMLDFYIDAEKKVLNGQSFTHNGKSWSMADLDKIRAGRKEWATVVRSFEGRRRAAQVRFVDMGH